MKYARWEPDEAEREIQGLKEKFYARKVPLIWMVGPSSRPKDLEVRLLQGFQHSTDWTGMVRELTEEETHSSYFRVKEVDTLL